LHHFFLFLRHLSMARLRRRRSSAALLFSVHRRVGHSVCFLFVFVAGLADRQLALHHALREDIAMRALRIQKRLYASRSAANHDL
jgi:hypothetical protein